MKQKIGWNCKQENNATETRHNETKQETVELVPVPANSENEMQKRLCKASPTALRKELNTTNLETQTLVIAEHVDVEKCSQNKKELVYSAEAVAKSLSKQKMDAA